MAYFVQGAAKPDVSALAQSLGHTPQTWAAAGHKHEPYSGRFELNPYVILAPPPPPATPATQAKRPQESCPVADDGLFVQGCYADAVLRGWSLPITSNTGAAARPLLIIGQSALECSHKGATLVARIPHKL